jgi:SAM-dependent methyltransferase
MKVNSIDPGKNDPIGLAIHEFNLTGKDQKIIVASDLCDDDELTVSYFFRTYNEMPELEKRALEFCAGTILDVGAGAGCHSHYLKQKGFEVSAIDVSNGAVEFLNSSGINASKKTIFDLDESQFDTILLLMNGMGLAESMEKLPAFLIQLKKILKPGGKIICDSSDISYLYTDDDGSFLIDLNGKYYGEMSFNMKYKNLETGWFDWLYIDYDNLADHAQRAGLQPKFIFEGQNNHYLAVLEKI